MGKGRGFLVGGFKPGVFVELEGPVGPATCEAERLFGLKRLDDGSTFTARIQLPDGRVITTHDDALCEELPSGTRPAGRRAALFAAWLARWVR